MSIELEISNRRHIFSCFSGVWLFFFTSLASAGSIGFSVDYTGDSVSITNNGSEAGYQVSLWSLDATEHWSEVKILAGNPAYVMAGQRLSGHRQAAGKTGLGRSDPLLVLLHDQAGGLIAQLAWRKLPDVIGQPLSFRRDDRQLHLTSDNADIRSTYGIAIPYDGINRLTTSFALTLPPPDPVLHRWSDSKSFSLDTGAGQNGAWLVHEMADGGLRLQIVADGSVRGSEQVPIWLAWARTWLMRIAAVLALIGGGILVAGLFCRRLTLCRKTHNDPT